VTNKADESSKQVFFLTGSTGFLGIVLAKQLQSDVAITKMCCPIRFKKGMLRADRLAQCLGSCNKCIHLEMDKAILSDMTHVILNACSTRFD
jgi:thioester reductase-like protein